MTKKRDDYEGVVKDYLSARGRLRSEKYIRALLKRLKPNSMILDLGCGVGEPIDNVLVAEGHSVLGIDISEEMINEARKRVVGASYQIGGIEELKSNEHEVDAVVCMYALFHISRSLHLSTLKKYASYLKKGGLLLITMGDRPFEGYADYLGKNMWWSQWGPRENLELVEKAGFEIFLDELARSGGESHQVIMAKRK